MTVLPPVLLTTGADAILQPMSGAMLTTGVCEPLINNLTHPHCILEALRRWDSMRQYLHTQPVTSIQRHCSGPPTCS